MKLPEQTLYFRVREAQSPMLKFFSEVLVIMRGKVNYHRCSRMTQDPRYFGKHISWLTSIMEHLVKRYEIERAVFVRQVVHIPLSDTAMF